MRTRIKVCGITTPNDAAMAARAGADYVGVVLTESPRPKGSGPVLVSSKPH